jgi:nitric oxide reductase large subunit
VVFAICATTAIGIYLFVIWKQDSARFWKTKKLIILWTGTFVVVALCLFPPWVANDKFVGHAYLFSDGNSYKSHIDLVRLIIQCAIVGLITGVLLYTLNVKKAEDGGK